jgi:hypothetical protein
MKAMRAIKARKESPTSERSETPADRLAAAGGRQVSAAFMSFMCAWLLATGA